MKKVITMVVFLAAFVLPMTAFAQDVTDPVAVSVLSYALELGAAVLMLAMSWVAARASSWLKRKTGIETEAMLAEWSSKGVDYAEEQARKFLKENGEKMRANDKLETALQFVWALADQNKIPAVGRDKLIGYVEAKLGQNRE